MDHEAARQIGLYTGETDAQLLIRTGDINPSEVSAVIVSRGEELAVRRMAWGFVPYRHRGLIINARSETAYQKKMFRDCLRYRRCAVPASCYYEWDSSKTKVIFSSGKSSVLYLAGIWQPDADVDRYCILTTAANESVSPVHDRMPVLLQPEELGIWLNDDRYVEKVFGRTPEALERRQDYEQLSLF